MSRKPRTPVTPEPLPMPPLTPCEVAAEQALLLRMQEMTRILRQRNLDDAVLLAQQAARGRGPLVDHFCELGRRFGSTLNIPDKPKLRVVNGAKPKLSSST